jgi:hypothetical protein
VLVDDDAAGGADLDARLAGEAVVGELPGSHHHHVDRDVAGGGLDRPHASRAQERLDARVEVGLDAHLPPGVLHRLHDVRVGDLRHGPGAGVDQMRLDAPVGQGRGHLHADRLRLHHRGDLGPLQDLVPAHGFADVADVVDAFQVDAGDGGPLVLEAGGDHQAVERLVVPALHAQPAGFQVDGPHPRLVADVVAELLVVLPTLEDEAVEGVDLPAVDVGDAAGAVGDVLLGGEDDHVGVGIRLLGRARRAHPGGAPTDDRDPPGHRTSSGSEDSSSYSFILYNAGRERRHVGGE